jgi:hypothetical protein
MEHYRQGELPAVPPGAPPWTLPRSLDPFGFVMAGGIGGLAFALSRQLDATRSTLDWGFAHFTLGLFVILLACVAASFLVKGIRAVLHRKAVLDFDDAGLRRLSASDANGLGPASWPWPSVRGCEVGRRAGGAGRAELVLEVDPPAVIGPAVRVPLGATDHGAAVARWIVDEAVRRRRPRATGLG